MNRQLASIVAAAVVALTQVPALAQAPVAMPQQPQQPLNVNLQQLLLQLEQDRKLKLLQH